MRAVFKYLQLRLFNQATLWRNGSASDSRSEGCVFKSRQGQIFFPSNFINSLKLEEVWQA
jgi:hypothetical protein